MGGFFTLMEMLTLVIKLHLRTLSRTTHWVITPCTVSA